MTRRTLFLILILALLPLHDAYAQEALKIDPFGTVMLFTPSSETPSGLVLLISGDGGWEYRVTKMAEVASETGALVAGIDITSYLGPQKGRDWSGCPSKDLENLSAVIQEKKHFGKTVRPLLVGYSSGATLAYAALMEAPSVFSGAITFGFCPDLHGAKVCEGDKLQWHKSPKKPNTILLDPTSELQVHWIAIQGDIDKECNPDRISLFVHKVSGAEMMRLKNVGHGFNFPEGWLSSFMDAVHKIENHGTS